MINHFTFLDNKVLNGSKICIYQLYFSTPIGNLHSSKCLFSSLDLIKFLISLGETLSFIRGCSKGKTDISVSGFHNFSADNQTACQYYPDSQDHLLACITWCQEDFCNGPLKYIKMVKEYTGTSSCSLLYTHKRIYTYLVFLISGILLL